MIIDKTHSKLDLIQLINTINIPVVFSHCDNKKNIHDKITLLFSNPELQKPLYIPNVYKINSYTDLKCYLERINPRKTLTVKQKQDILKICKNIISYCNNGKNIEYSEYYNDQQQIKDDMDYIKQWGDIPSVRRCCKIMNKDLKVSEYYIPLVSPQVMLWINDKVSAKPVVSKKLVIKRDPTTIIFE